MTNRWSIAKIGVLMTSLFLTLISGAAPAFAQTSVRDTVRTKVASAAAAKQEKRLAKIKDRSQKAIDERTSRIASTSSTIGTLDFLKSEERQGLLNMLDPVSAGLQSLGTTIKSDTSAETARVDYQKIFSDYRVFAVLLPRVRLEIFADHLLLVADNLTIFTDTLDSRIKELKMGGSDTTKFEGQVAALRSKLAKIKIAIETAMTSIKTIDVKNYPSTNQTIKSVRSQLQSIHTDLKSSYKDARTIVAGIKALKKADAKPTASSSAKPTASASASQAI